MSIKIKSVICSHQAGVNQQTRGLDILGHFDALIQPVFPFGMPNIAAVINFEGIVAPETFEMRLNSPSDQLVSKGEFQVAPELFGYGKKVVNFKEFIVVERGKYTLDIFHKTEEGLKFLATEDLFIAEYPPKRIFRKGEVEAIIGAEDVIKSVKTAYQPMGEKDQVLLQLGLDENEPLEEGHILFPKNDQLEMNGKTFDLTGLRREIEWMFGRPIPKQQEEAEGQEETK